MSQENTNEAGAAFNDLYHKVPALVSRDHFDVIHSFLKRRIGKELESAQRIIGNMAADLGAIHDALGLHPDDAAGAPPILTAIAELNAQPGVDFRATVQAMIAKMESGEWDEKSVEGIGSGDLLAEHLSTVITELHCELDDAMEGRVLTVMGTPAPSAGGVPVATLGLARTAIAKSVFGGINALRWILNITTEFDRKDVRTRQATRLLDEYCTGAGTTNRTHLEHLWKTLNDALSVEDTLECLATRDAAPITDASEDPIRKFIAAHAEQLEHNDYAYFELAYTRHTAWMAWLCSNSRDDDPNRKVLAKGQGHSPEEACEAALASMGGEPT